MCIVVGQGSGFDSRSWRRFLPVLQEFPLATIPGNSSDDQVRTIYILLAQVIYDNIRDIVIKYT